MILAYTSQQILKPIIMRKQMMSTILSRWTTLWHSSRPAVQPWFLLELQVVKEMPRDAKLEMQMIIRFLILGSIRVKALLRPRISSRWRWWNSWCRSQLPNCETLSCSVSFDALGACTIAFLNAFLKNQCRFIYPEDFALPDGAILVCA